MIMDLNRSHSGNLDAINTSNGARVEAARSGVTKGATLANGVTYVFPLDTNGAPLECVHLKWDAAVIVTFTVETTVFPKFEGGHGNGPSDVTDHSLVAGEWMQENPSGAYVSGSGAGGMTATNLTLVVAGGTAGGSTIHLGNLGSLRGRIRAVVAGTGGVVRCGVNGKSFTP